MHVYTQTPYDLALADLASISVYSPLRRLFILLAGKICEVHYEWTAES